MQECLHCGGEAMEIVLNKKEGIGYHACKQCLIATPAKKLEESAKIWNKKNTVQVLQSVTP